jgi:hypothetical protein
MIQTFDNALSAVEIDQLLEWFHTQDSLVDDRLDVRSKTPGWADNSWPKELVKKVLDQVLTESYVVEVVLFYGSRISFKLHVDSGDGDGRPLYKNVLIPLYVEGSATTVLFDNYWYGPHVRFGRVSTSPFLYTLPNRKDKLQTVSDIRILLAQCEKDPKSVIDFDVDLKFINTLQHIVQTRSGNSTKPPDDYVTDYKDIVNYRPGTKFDSSTHQQYLSHIPVENLHGLTVDQVVPWQVGQVVTFDRNQIHSAGSGHEFKIGISIFTYKV